MDADERKKNKERSVVSPATAVTPNAATVPTITLREVKEWFVHVTRLMLSMSK